MTSKTIKISDENYRWLLHVVSELQKRKGKLVSFDEALDNLKKGVVKGKLSDLAGSWDMDDKEADNLKKWLKKGWGKWKIESV